MPPIDTLRALFVHGDWARDRLLDACAPLTGDQLDRPFEMGFGSLRGTLHHLWWAERLWLDRWGDGLAAATPPRSEPGLSVDELRRRFGAVAAERDALLDRAGVEGQSRRIDYRSSDGATHRDPLGDLMLHVCDHGVHHRAQALNMLRRVGATPPRLDLLVLQREGLPPDGAPAPETAFDPPTITEYYAHADWARGRVHEIARGLDDAALDRAFEMGPGSLRKTLVHVVNAEAWWLEHWEGRAPEELTLIPAESSIDDLDRAAAAIAGRREAILRASDGADLRRLVHARLAPDRTYTFTVGDLMLQLCGHGTHHRAQAVNMLRHLGAETPRLDYVHRLRVTAAPSA